MLKVLVIDSSARDAQRFQKLLVREGVEVEVCLSGAEAERMLTSSAGGFFGRRRPLGPDRSYLRS